MLAGLATGIGALGVYSVSGLSRRGHDALLFVPELLAAHFAVLQLHAALVAINTRRQAEVR